MLSSLPDPRWWADIPWREPCCFTHYSCPCYKSPEPRWWAEITKTEPCCISHGAKWWADIPWRGPLCSTPVFIKFTRALLMGGFSMNRALLYKPYPCYRSPKPNDGRLFHEHSLVLLNIHALIIDHQSPADGRIFRDQGLFQPSRYRAKSKFSIVQDPLKLSNFELV